jgi:hypothetical protein
MGLTVGPSTSHPSYVNWYTTALGSTVCGGRLFCKSLGIAWIVAPAATQVFAGWNGSSGAVVGNKPCVSDWSSLNTALINGGLTPSQWFVPSCAQLISGFNCRTYWDTFTNTSGNCVYWSSTESSNTFAIHIRFDGSETVGGTYKPVGRNVRAFRCVTY